MTSRRCCHAYLWYHWRLDTIEKVLAIRTCQVLLGNCTCQASDISTILKQWKAQEIPYEVRPRWRLFYYSRKLLSHERCYAATDKEGLAVVSACQHFLPYLIWWRFTVITDHQALKFHHNKDITSGCLVQWFDSLIELHFDISYHCVADNSNVSGLPTTSSGFRLILGFRCQTSSAPQTSSDKIF